MTRSSCTSILIGKAASADGSVIIGRNEDSKASWPKHFVKRPARTEPVADFVSPETGVTIPLPDTAYAYTATPEWTDQYGLFEEDGINSAGVAMSATESAYANPRVLGFDPFTDKGINEECMVTITLPYIDSARAGVQRLGALIETYGTGEANGILFADKSEAWYMEVVTGHQWAALRIPDDAYAVVANQLSLEVLDPDSDDCLMSQGLQDFAARHHLWQPGTQFNLRHIFGTDSQQDRLYNTPRVWYGHKLLSPAQVADETPTSSNLPFLMHPDQPLQVEQAMAYLSSHYQDTPYDPVARLPQGDTAQAFRPIALAKTQESHVLQMRQNLPNAIAGIHWLAMGVPDESQFVPFFAGLTDTPEAYQRGALPASLDSAYWQFKLTGVLIDPHYHRFLPALRHCQEDTHARFVQLIEETDERSRALTDADALAALATEASMTAAEIAATSWSKLQMSLLNQSTDLSPLNFKTDPDL